MYSYCYQTKLRTLMDIVPKNTPTQFNNVKIFINWLTQMKFVLLLLRSLNEILSFENNNLRREVVWCKQLWDLTCWWWQVPLVTHSLPKLRALSLSHNMINSLTNTSLLGGAERLRELDITHLPLNYFEVTREFVTNFLVVKLMKTLNIWPN